MSVWWLIAFNSEADFQTYDARRCIIPIHGAHCDKINIVGWSSVWIISQFTGEDALIGKEYARGEFHDGWGLHEPFFGE